MNAKIVAVLALVAAVAIADCNNAADRNVFATQSATFHATLQQCSISCWGASDCVTNCMIRTTGLSASCAACFGADAQCMARYCITQCASAPTSQACLDCHTARCLPGLLNCAQVPQDILPQ
eukprot:m51a1_g5778 hypothetical protein (122) ;mRNA; r:1257561-1258011